MEFVDSATWEAVRAEIIARGPNDRQFTLPKDAAWERLTDKSKAWALSYFRSGGDSRAANEAGGYSTPAHLTLYRFLGDDTPAVQRMRTYLAAMNQAFRDGVGGGAVADAPASGEAFVPIPATDPASVTPTQPPSPPSAEIVAQPPIYVPEIVQPSEEIDAQEAERDTTVAKRVWRNSAAFRLKDFMKLIEDEDGKTVDWEWDLEAIRNAPVGVVKGLSRDGKGYTRVEFSSATDSAKLLADHYKPKENDGGRVDIRSVVVNILQSGDPSARYRLDQLAKEAAERLRDDREKKQLAG